MDDVVLDITGPARGDISGDPAIGVEQCTCPTGYTGLSCEVHSHISISIHMIQSYSISLKKLNKQ